MNPFQQEEPLTFRNPSLGAPLSGHAEWLRSEKISGFAERHQRFLGQKEDALGFNLFHLISDVYHRENLHSDMMEAIIDPSGTHGHGDTFLRLFLSFLRERHGVDFPSGSYQRARTFREAGKIDLLICDDENRRAIIVENKINGATDMDQQVVRYLKKVQGDGYFCDTIVYLCLNQKKPPSMFGWPEEEQEKVLRLLRVVCAYDNSQGDLCSGWLQPTIAAASNEQVAHNIRQYQQVIRYLGRTLMNKPLMSDFYEMLKSTGTHETAFAVAAMISNLSEYRSQRLMDTFMANFAPFSELYLYRPTLLIFEGLGEGEIKLHVDCTQQDVTKLGFWNNTTNDPQGELPRRILEEAGMIDVFDNSTESGWFERGFSFPTEEDRLYAFIHDFKEALKGRTSNVV